MATECSMGSRSIVGLILGMYLPEPFADLAFRNSEDLNFGAATTEGTGT